MSDHSIEHSMVFNTARRVLKFVAPNFRAVATEFLKPGQSVLDLRKCTVEVPEGNEYAAAGMIVFAAGFVKFMGHDTGGAVDGRSSSMIRMSNEEAESYAAMAHCSVDKLAYNWASKVMVSYYPELDPERAMKLVDQRQSYGTWLSYFKGK